ncbi:MAG: CDP-alcohol phosphatidyltransferase family protein [Candidatus Micrarchaeota archaeon]|nr:CDP-alcohol phosphatidyltransferase family protein [Candidatus Micrarchaeota archaeon]
MIKNTGFASKVSENLGKIFAKLPIDPNAITILSLLLAIMAYISYGPHPVNELQSLILFGFAFFFDAIDGAVARAVNKVTKEGAFLDGVIDRCVEFFLILTLFSAFTFNLEAWKLLLVILFFGTGMTSFVKAYAEHRGMMTHEEAAKLPGLLERTERVILLMLIFVATIFSTMDHVRILLYITAALSIVTFLQRTYLIMYGKKTN